MFSSGCELAVVCRNPLLAYVYERGYRDVFDIFNFPGYNEEVTCTLIVAISAHCNHLMV